MIHPGPAPTFLKKLRLFYAGILCLFAVASHAATDNYIPDETTAIAVAKAILRPIVGSDRIYGAKASPFHADLSGKIWHVGNALRNCLQCVGATLHVEMEAQSGRIILVRDEGPLQTSPYNHSDVWVVMKTAADKKKWMPQIPPCVYKRSASGAYQECNYTKAHDLSLKGFVPDEQAAEEIAKAVAHLTGKLYTSLDKERATWTVGDFNPAVAIAATNVAHNFVSIDKTSGRINP